MPKRPKQTHRSFSNLPKLYQAKKLRYVSTQVIKAAGATVNGRITEPLVKAIAMRADVPTGVLIKFLRREKGQKIYLK